MRRDDAATENCRLQCRPIMSMKQKCLQQFRKQNRDIDMSVMCGGSEFQMAGPA